MGMYDTSFQRSSRLIHPPHQTTPPQNGLNGPCVLSLMVQAGITSHTQQAPHRHACSTQCLQFSLTAACNCYLLPATVQHNTLRKGTKQVWQAGLPAAKHLLWFVHPHVRSTDTTTAAVQLFLPRGEAWMIH